MKNLILALFLFIITIVSRAQSEVDTNYTHQSYQINVPLRICDEGNTVKYSTDGLNVGSLRDSFVFYITGISHFENLTIKVGPDTLFHTQAIMYAQNEYSLRFAFDTLGLIGKSFSIILYDATNLNITDASFSFEISNVCTPAVSGITNIDDYKTILSRTYLDLLGRRLLGDCRPCLEERSYTDGTRSVRKIYIE